MSCIPPGGLPCRPPRIYQHVPPWLIPFFAMTLPFWREAAIRRHAQFNLECEGGDPRAWETHKRMIAWEYGW